MPTRVFRWLFAAMLLLPWQLPAQSTFATITGTVTDSTGAVVPGAKVTVTHLTTNLTYSTESNTAGAYTLANLREGDYRLVAGAAGFKDVTVDRVSLAGRDVRRVDVALQVEAVQEAIEVSATAGLIETESGRISDLRTANELNSYAANATSRSAWRYFSLTPMFVNVRGGSVPSLAGSRADQWQVAFDGSTISNGMSGNTGGNIMDYSDWIREVRTDYVTNSAENGQLAHISVVSKSGENDLHGAAFDIYGSPVFRARPPFQLDRPTGVTHNLGVSGGGPVYLPKLYNGRNKTFWFIAGEEYTGNATSASRNATAPIEAWRNGQFSVPIRNPFTGETYMDGKIPAQYINPVSKRLQDIFFPLPNYGDVTTGVYSQNFRSTGITPFNTQQNLMTRLDERFGDKDYVYATFMMNQLKQRGLEGSLPVFGPRNGLRKQKMLNVTYSHTFRHNLLNEFRYGHGADTNDVRGTLDAASLVRSLGIQGLAPDLPDLPGSMNLSFTGTGITGTNGLNRSLYAPRTETVQDQVSWFKGRQNIRIGGLFAYAHPTELSASSNLFGSASFSGKYTADSNIKGSGNAYADFLFGIPNSTQRAFAPLSARRRRTWQDLFIQDTWRVSSKLTLDLGLRYEYRPAWREDSGMMAVFDPATGAMVVPDGSLGKVSPLLPKTYRVIEASQAGYPARLIATDKNNVAPRFGIAWQPFKSHTVLRGGYGIYYDATPTQVNMAGQPFAIDEGGYTNPYPNAGGIVFPQLLPAQGSGAAASVSLADAFNPRLKIPYSQQWSATIEHEYAGFGFRLNYAGTATRQMVCGRDINSPVPDERLYVNKPRPYQQYATAIPYYDNGASHTYHAGSFTLTRRMKNGLQMESSYTWARDIGDAVSGLIENPFDRRRERGPELSIPTHRFATSWIWEMPIGRKRLLLSNIPRALDAAIGGWQLAGNFILQSGQFLTPTITVDDPVGIYATTSTTPSRKSIRPDLLGDPNNGPKTVARWFDPTVFAAPPKGRFGTSGRSVIVGPGINVWHATLQKYFRFSDNPRMPRMRLDLFAANVFNHPNYDNPNVNLSSGNSVATITDTGGINRSTLGDSANDRLMRVGLRIEW